jgi:transposase
VVRERAELIAERVSIVNRIGAIPATLGTTDYNTLLQTRRRCLDDLRTASDQPLPNHARAKIIRLLTRLELVLAQVAEIDQQRDAVLNDRAPDAAGQMIQQLAGLRGVGVQSATILVREAFVRRFANGKALGTYAGLTATPYNSGGTEREQGIGKAGNRRLRTVMVELAWIWQRYQPNTTHVRWFHERAGPTAPGCAR